MEQFEHLTLELVGMCCLYVEIVDFLSASAQEVIFEKGF